MAKPWTVERGDLISSLALYSIGDAFPMCKCSIDDRRRSSLTIHATQLDEGYVTTCSPISLHPPQLQSPHGEKRSGGRLFLHDCLCCVDDLFGGDLGGSVSGELSCVGGGLGGDCCGVSKGSFASVILCGGSKSGRGSITEASSRFGWLAGGLGPPGRS